MQKFAMRRMMRFTGMAAATSDPALRAERIFRADLWALRENFLSGHLTWPDYRKAVSALRKRRARAVEPRRFSIATIPRPVVRRISTGEDSRSTAAPPWPRGMGCRPASISGEPSP
ncbi:MAG: hypothetical protein Q8P46_00195 [Hyphomicrobiales bacterium]|nr:hypothetical protein [Hyphomicrobiales bacterium]